MVGCFGVIDASIRPCFPHIRDAIDGPAWDIGFFVVAVTLIAAEYALMRRPSATSGPPA